MIFKKHYIMEWHKGADRRTRQQIISIWFWQNPSIIIEYWKGLHGDFNLNNLRRL